MTKDWLKGQITLNNLILLLSTIQFCWLIWFFYTGLGGGQELVSRVMSLALTLQILFVYRDGYLYKWLPPMANHILVAIYIGICTYAFIHFLYEFEEITIYRQGSWTTQDFIGMQVQGINANPQIPVHPGLAKFLKEHKAWNDKWKVGGSSS